MTGTFFTDFYSRDTEGPLEPGYAVRNCEKDFFPVQQRRETYGIHPCVDALHGELCGGSIRYTLQAALFPPNFDSLASHLPCFSASLLSALHRTTMSSTDDTIARLLNDGGVDSAVLAEVMTDYFCEDDDDYAGQFTFLHATKIRYVVA